MIRMNHYRHSTEDAAEALQALNGLVALEWRAGLGSYAQAWEEAGGQCVTIAAGLFGKGAPSSWLGKSALGPAKHKPAACFATLTEGMQGEEMKFFSQEVLNATSSLRWPTHLWAPTPGRACAI